MHGHPYPILSDRPLPQPQAVSQDSCWLDDPDHPDDESSGGQAMPVTEVDSASSDSVEIDRKPSSLSRVDSQSVAALASSLTAPFSVPESQHSMASASSQTLPTSSQHSPCQADSSTSSIPLDRPSHQKGGSSPYKHSLTKPNFHAASKLRKRNLSTAQRHVAESSEEVSRRFGQADDQRSSFSFNLPLFWIKPKRSRSDDSAHEGQGSATSSPKTKGRTCSPAQAGPAVSYKQQKLLLNFKDKSLEKRYCLWQAQQTKVVFILIRHQIQLTAAECASSQHASLLTYRPAVFCVISMLCASQGNLVWQLMRPFMYSTLCVLAFWTASAQACIERAVHPAPSQPGCQMHTAAECI